MEREEISNRISDLVFESEYIGTIIDEEDAIKANRILNIEIELRKKAEKLRVEEKAPIIKLGKEIDEFFNSLKKQCQEIQDNIKPSLNEYILQCKRKADEEAARLRDEAERAKEIAMARLEAKDNGSNGASEDEVEEALKEADKAAYNAKKANYDANNVKVSGGDTRARGLKTTWEVEVVDAKALVEALSYDERLQELAIKIANSMAKTYKEKLNLAGVKVISKQSV